MKIAVYCASSRHLDQKYFDLGYEFGTILAKRGHTLVYGGYNEGIMGKVAEGVTANGGGIIAVVPKLFDTEEMTYPDCKEVLHTATMSDRKSTMEFIADGFAVLPGGIGTYDEFFGTLCLKMLGELDKPIAILNAFGYYEPMRTMLEKNREEGFLDYGALDEIKYFTECKALLEELENGLSGNCVEIADETTNMKNTKAENKPKALKISKALKKTDGIILDVDGTLWDSTGIVAKAWTRAVRENGCQDKTITPGMLQALFGRTMDVIADNLLPELTPEHRYRIMDVCCVYEQQALEAMEGCVKSETGRDLPDECAICYPGVQKTIRELSEHVPVFIVSNCQKGYIELFLDKTALGAYVTDFECFGNTGKSKDENIRLLVERNHLKRPVYVGDTQGDCDASKKAEVPFIYAKYGFGTVDDSDAEIESFPELKMIL